MGDFQEEQRHLLLIFQHNSMSNLPGTDTICMDTTNNFILLHKHKLHSEWFEHLWQGRGGSCTARCNLNKFESVCGWTIALD